MELETYTIRNANGTMLMKVVGSTVQRMFKELIGEWASYNVVGKKPSVCYKLTEDAVWTSGNHDSAFKMYLWEGTKIIKD